MNEYRLLLSKDLRIIKNHFLEIKNNPKRLMIYLLYVVWIGSMIFNFVIQSKADPFNPVKDTMGSAIVGAGFTALISIVLLYYIHKGTMESSTFFSMGDVHLLFPSPNSPKKILLYQMVKHSITQVFTMVFFMLIFFPSIVRMTNLDLKYVGYMYLSYMGIAMAIGPINFMIFAMGTKYRIQSLLRNGIYGSIFIYLGYLVMYAFYSDSLITGLINGLNAKWIMYIPIIGWSKAAFMVPIEGYSTYGLISVLLLLLSIIVFIVLCYFMADDYYEDVLGATEKKALRKKIKKGQKGESKVLFINRNKQSKVKSTGSGAWAMIWKTKVEYSKTDLHPYFSLMTVFSVLLGAAVGYFVKNEMSDYPMYFINGIVAYALFIFSSAQAKNNELMKPYIFLIPGKPIEKILATNFINVVRVGISGLLLNTTMGIFIGAPIYLIMILSIFLVSFHLLNLSSNYIIRSVFPSAVDQKALFPLLVMLQILLLLIPGILLGFIFSIIFKNIIFFFIGIILANFVIITGLLLLANLIFDKMEWR